MSTVARMEDALGTIQRFSSATAVAPEPPVRRLLVRSFGLGAPAGYDEAANGNRLYHRDPIFRVGTFKDSLGMSNTWEGTHLSQMAFHFGMLRDAGKLTSVPWRDGHPSIFGGGGDVLGWFQDVYFEDEYLYVDWLCTEPEAGEKYDRGTFGPRSAEIGYYESNDEALYWPVVMGCAFVDIPAVEGLFTKERSMQQLNAFTALPDADVQRRILVFNGQQAPGNGGGNGGDGGTGNGGEGGAGGGTTPAPQQPDPHPVTGNPAAEPQGGEGGGEHRSGQQAHTFTIHGQPTTDFAAVQRHITTLVTALHEQAMQARQAFVADLANRNVIPATRLEEFQSHVALLTPEQYDSWSKLYSDAGPTPLLAPHGDPQQHQSGEQTLTPEQEQVQIDKEVVQQHQRARMPADQIKETASYKRLVTAGQAPTL